jgi:hypothetical protein
VCLYPRLILNKKYLPNKKNGFNPPILTDSRVKSVPVKCGKCIECMKSKARDWLIRLTEEIKTNNNGYFITLTMSNEEYVKLSTETDLRGYERDNWTITLAVRRYLERHRKEYKKSIKHWLVTELGHNGTKNIHAHGIIFTDKPENIEKEWKYGYVYIGKYVNNKTINYITKYISKIDFDHKYYQPKILCSPGIGSNYINRSDAKLNKFNNDKTKETYRFNNGTKSSLPIYYRNKIYSEKDREILWINKIEKHTRYVCGEKISIKNSIDTYTNVVNYYRVINSQLGYGQLNKDDNQNKYENQLRDLNHIKRINSVAAQQTESLRDPVTLPPEAEEENSDDMEFYNTLKHIKFE